MDRHAIWRVGMLMVLSLLFVVPLSAAENEQTLRARISAAARAALAGRKIVEPTDEGATRSPAGPRLYREKAAAVPLVIQADAKDFGSGILISQEGLIVTNSHVVDGGRVAGVILKRPGLTWLENLSEADVQVASVVADDPGVDLALLALRQSSGNLPCAALGDLTRVEIGQDVFAITHPQGFLWTYTEGVVSQIRPGQRWQTAQGDSRTATLIQTQTTVAPGSSGGPLFGLDGAVVGLVVSGVPEFAGLNFAIAVNELQNFLRLARVEARCQRSALGQ